MTALTPRCGVNRTMALPIRYAPISIGGGGFTELFTEQCYAQISTALKFLRTPTSQPGITLRILISWVQAYIGTSYFVWKDVHRICPPVPAPWVMAVRGALKHVHGSIDIQDPDSLIPPPLRQNDIYLMDHAISQGLRQQHLSRINSCRRYLQVVTLADIANPKGTAIYQCAKSGVECDFEPWILGERFNQPRPSPAAWKTWRTFLHSFENTRGTLIQPLHSWTRPHHYCRWRQPYIYDPATKSLYRRNIQGYHQLNPRSADTFELQGELITALPDLCYPVQVHEYFNLARMLHNYHIDTIAQDLFPLTFEIFVTRLPLWERELLECHTLSEPPESIVTQLNSRPFLVASDGSVIENKASFGYVIASGAKVRLIRGRGPAAGADPQSFRAEGYGGLASTRMLLRLQDFTGIQLTQSFKHFIDNKAVVDETNKGRKYHSKYANTTLKSDWDVMSTFISSSLRLPAPSYHWIRGHQDRDLQRDSLSLAAVLNCEADDEAGRFQLTNITRLHVPMMETTLASLTLKGSTITGHYKTKIREAATMREYSAYVKRRFDWTDATHTIIDWQLYPQILKKHRQHHLLLMKHCHGIAPTGTIAHRNNSVYPISCPSCDTDQETNDHVLQCPAPARAKWRQQFLRKISLSGIGQPHDPVLLDILRDGIQRWFRSESPPSITEYPTLYSSLIIDQTAIGWVHLFRGRWALQWNELHSQYLTRTHTQHTPSNAKWITKLGIMCLREWLEVWKLRSADRHGKDKAAQTINRTAHLLAQLEELYALKHKVLPAHRHLFLSDAQTHLESTRALDSLEDWIHAFRPAILSSVKQAQSITHLLWRNHRQ